MPPKKKGNKKAADDWEAELGESIAPTNGDATAAAAAAPEENDAEEDAPAGGLMAMMKKNREKRKKKGLSENFVDGEDAPGAEPTVDVAAKAPEEAAMDDEFALPEKKSKGGKQNKQQQPAKPAAADAGDDETGEGGRMLTKAEKEKLKKEREKQRKKEQVSKYYEAYILRSPTDPSLFQRPQRRRLPHLPQRPRLRNLRSRPRRRRKRLLRQHPLPRLQVRKGRSFPHIYWPSRNSKRSCVGSAKRRSVKLLRKKPV